MKNELVLDNYGVQKQFNDSELVELSAKESKELDGGWFGPFGFGFRVYFHLDTKGLLNSTSYSC